MNHLKEECEHMKTEKEAENQRLLEELDVKTTTATELEKEVMVITVLQCRHNTFSIMDNNKQYMPFFV